MLRSRDVLLRSESTSESTSATKTGATRFGSGRRETRTGETSEREGAAASEKSAGDEADDEADDEAGARRIAGWVLALDGAKVGRAREDEIGDCENFAARRGAVLVGCAAGTDVFEMSGGEMKASRCKIISEIARADAAKEGTRKSHASFRRGCGR